MRWTAQFALLSFAALLWCLRVGAAADESTVDFGKLLPGPSTYEQETYQRIAREEQERFRKRVTIPAEALQDEAQLTTSTGPAGTYTKVSAGRYPSIDSARNVLHNTCVAALGILLGCLALRRFAPQFAAVVNTRFDPWAPSAAAARRFASQARAEEASFAEFLVAFRAGPAVVPHAVNTPSPGPAAEAPTEIPEAESRFERQGVEDFFVRAPERLSELQQLLEEIRWRAGATSAQRKLLEKFLQQLGVLKEPTGLPELLPAWQMACALEGLIKQLLSKASYVTASTLRTIGISLDLLEDLCVKGLPPDLMTNPPLRLLAVDDDRISRHALSWSLSKALSQPDLAENGEAALALVNGQSYDAIFLDVQMPGMDGFELCSKIHETAPNRITPVVFVTCQSDFNARAESTLCGGYDLIGKPFLTFEITVVALTLALRRRLQARDRISASRKRPVSAERVSSSADRAPAVQRSLPGVHGREPETATPETPRNPPPERLAPASPDGAAGRAADAVSPSGASRPSPELAAAATGSAKPSKVSTHELAKAFFAQAPNHIRSLRDMAQLIRQTADADTRQEMLGDLYLFMHSLTINASLADLRLALQLSAVLEGLLKKLLESPANSTTAALQTVVTALDLLGDLCVEGATADVSTHPPIRLLVVDDDPIARRALGGALQTTFEKPDLAENAATALALAAQHNYDVVFLDVLMPDMDGFTLCPKIHETEVNRRAPVVFVTSRNDPQVITQSTDCGGSDVVIKPFLTAEITVKALVFALRHRLQSPLAAPPKEEAAAPGCRAESAATSYDPASQSPLAAPPKEEAAAP
jgi:CheY-like chemotaxis protein